MPFAFENLDVYKLALDLVQEVCGLTGPLKNKIPYSMIDQMTRAALFIPLNIDESYKGR